MSQPKFALTATNSGDSQDGESDEGEASDNELSEEDEHNEPTPTVVSAEKNVLSPSPQPASQTPPQKVFPVLHPARTKAEKKLREDNERLRSDIAKKIERSYAATERGLQVSKSSLGETLMLTQSVVSHMVEFREAMEYLSESTLRLTLPINTGS